MKNYLIVFAGLAILSSTVQAQWSSDSLQNSVVKDGTGISEIIPLQATTEDGLTYISWFESNNANYKMMMQLLDQEGNKLWGDDGLLISEHPTGSALYVYDLAVDHEGNAIVAFQDERNGDLMPVAYKLDPSGDFIWGNDGIVLHDSLATFELAPAIGVLSSNDIVIAWNASASKKWIAIHKITADGELYWSSAKTIKANNKNFSRAQFAQTNDETFLLNYIQETGSFPSVTSTLFANRFDIDGNGIWAVPVSVSAYTTSFFEWPSVISDTQNGMFVAFNSGVPGNPSTIDAFVQHLDSSGTKLFGDDGAEAAVFSNNHRSLSGIAYLIDSNQLGISLKVLDSGQGQAGIYAQKLDATGNRLWGDTGNELLPLSSTDYHEPFGLQLAEDGFMVAYTEGSVTSQDLKVVKFDLNGDILWNRMLSAVNSNKYDVTMGSIVNDQLAVVWEDERSGSGVYAQNINGDGSLGAIATATSEAVQNTLSVYPTLAHDWIRIFCDEEFLSGRLEVTDVNGKVLIMQTESDLSSEVNISSLPPGFYFYSIRQGALMQKGKICRQ